MRALIVLKGEDGRRLDRVLSDRFPGTGSGAFRKAFSNRDVKINGARSDPSARVRCGDRIEVYVSDELLDQKPEAAFRLVYEDGNLLVAEKRQGVPVHANEEGGGYNLEDALRSDFLARHENADFFLCHRLDRNTGGLVMLARNRACLAYIIERMEKQRIVKTYTCLLHGQLPDESGILTAYLTKDSRAAVVRISDTEFPGSLMIRTKYRILDFRNGVSLAEAELLTGRTHQIRAQFAHIGHPVVGDGKYGTNALNRPLGASIQALWASRLEFRFEPDGGAFGYLAGMVFESKPSFAGIREIGHLPINI
jgi:23S rRNA pseudouridine955/2504/2580 synthase